MSSDVSSDRDHMREYMKARYHRRRAEAIQTLGGRCVDCGTVNDLTFDHEDPSLKTWSMSKILAGGSAKKVAGELKKCVLRCKPCHDAKTTANGDLCARRIRDIVCKCGRPFTDRLQYAGHSRWCK